MKNLGGGIWIHNSCLFIFGFACFKEEVFVVEPWEAIYREIEAAKGRLRAVLGLTSAAKPPKCMFCRQADYGRLFPFLIRLGILEKCCG